MPVATLSGNLPGRPFRSASGCACQNGLFIRSGCSCFRWQMARQEQVELGSSTSRHTPPVPSSGHTKLVTNSVYNRGKRATNALKELSCHWFSSGQLDGLGSKALTSWRQFRLTCQRKRVTVHSTPQCSTPVASSCGTLPLSPA